ncbi:hypothetical protein N9Y42_07785 [Mariniblastus sp.]|nr:hypothetical protein [Mariniblastus sp.]
MKFSLRALILIVTVCVIASLFVAQHLNSKTPITQVTTMRQWEEVASGGRLVLFVDNSFHNETQYYGDRFDSFCRIARSKCKRNPVMIFSPMKNPELKTIIDLLWKDGGFHGNYKGWGGRGVIAWVEDGELLHSTWISHVDSNEEFIRLCDSAFSDTE